MIKSALTSRLIIFAPKKSNPEDSQIMHSLEPYCRDQGMRVFKTHPYFLAFESFIDSEITPTGRPLLICDLLPGKKASDRDFAFYSREIDWSRWHQKAESQAQFYNLILSNQTEFTLESDLLGLKQLYLTDTSHGTLITSKIIDVFRLDKKYIQPIDQVALSQLILTGHPFGTRTIHSKIRRTSTGERLHWDNSSCELLSSRPRRLKISNDVRADSGLIESVRYIDDSISNSIRTRTEGISKSINIALSGGFDSRILAAVLRKQTSEFSAFTYGHWHHREVLTAKKIAKILGVNHSILPYPIDNHYKRMDLFLNTLEGQSDSNSVQIANLLQMNKPLGTPLFHGFMSDAVAVIRFSDKKNDIAPKSLDEAALNLASSIVKSESHLKFISNLLEIEISAPNICDEIRQDMTKEGQAYHAAVLWDVENRQRRFIAGHIPMLGQIFDIITPFYDKRLMSYWLSMPRISLDERYLQRQQLAKLYPELAKIPHSEETTPITPNLSNQLKLLIDTTLRKMFITPFQKYTGYRTSNIWSLSGGMATNDLKNHMQALFSENIDCADRVLGLGNFRNKEVMAYFDVGPSTGDYITPRIIFQTTAYAKWIEDSLQ